MAPSYHHPNPTHTTTSVTTATGNVLTTITTDTVTSVTTAPLNTPHTLLSVARGLDAKVTRWLDAPPRSPLSRRTHDQTRTALAVVADALARYRFDELALSFNGGKDCLVLLVLYLVGIARRFGAQAEEEEDAPAPSAAAIAPTTITTTTTCCSTSNSAPSVSVAEAENQHHSPSPLTSTHQEEAAEDSDEERERRPLNGERQPTPQTIPSVYVMSTHPFAEVDEFVDECTTAYHLSLSRFPVPMKTAFQTYLAQHAQVRAIFVGTRRTDPHGAKLTFFDRTDHGWPDFVRVHPVIDWHYQEIWAFLRELEIPYCSLYDAGYTSLGGTTDTHPNPALAIKSDNETTPKTFRPAYELMDDDEERLGRDR